MKFSSGGIENKILNQYQIQREKKINLKHCKYWEFLRVPDSSSSHSWTNLSWFIFNFLKFTNYHISHDCLEFMNSPSFLKWFFFKNNILRSKTLTYLEKGNSLEDGTEVERFLQPLFEQAGFGSNHLQLSLKIKQTDSKGRRVPKISLTAIPCESKEAPLSCLILFSMPMMCEKNACAEKKNKSQRKWILISKEMVLIVFPVPLILRLSFQMPPLSCLALPSS